jgi:hypothetical protein
MSRGATCVSKPPLVYASSPHIKWVTDDTRVIIVNEQTHRHLVLTEAEAAIWNWLTIPYPYQKLLPLVTALWSLAPATAEERLHHVLRRWHEEGLLTTPGGEVDG